MKPEIRTFATELRSGDSRKIGGHAVMWNQPSQDLPFTEQFAPGAFLDSLADTSRDVWMLWSHDISKPLASRNSGTLMLAEDSSGLAFNATLNGTSWAADAYEAIRAGTVRGVSFRFSVPEGGDSWKQDGKKLTRTVRKAILHEVSPTPMPAYPQTDVSVRSVADVLAGARLDTGIVLRDLLQQTLEIERCL